MILFAIRTVQIAPPIMTDALVYNTLLDFMTVLCSLNANNAFSLIFSCLITAGPPSAFHAFTGRRAIMPLGYELLFPRIQGLSGDGLARLSINCDIVSSASSRTATSQAWPNASTACSMMTNMLSNAPENASPEPGDKQIRKVTVSLDSAR